MVNKYKTLFLIAPTVFLLDLFTKWLILKNLSIGQEITVIPNFFEIVHIRNTGAAFGMLASLHDGFRVPFFYLISFVAAAVLIYCFVTLEKGDHFHAIPLSLIAGGVLGNVTDRFRFGNVVDFLSFHVGDKIISGMELRWPAFNVADSAITVAVVLLAAHALKNK